MRENRLELFLQVSCPTCLAPAKHKCVQGTDRALIVNRCHRSRYGLAVRLPRETFEQYDMMDVYRAVRAGTVGFGKTSMGSEAEAIIVMRKAWKQSTSGVPTVR